ncbi:ComEC/Rec2 family competence protein [Flavisolibacter tropicus]|uniref:ComEC/Rec2 family competence protein n=1 Tax=Flavisolibacter tropicus TaxID=1492898 RepID=UPI00083433D6|nr:MBL fold metallo-hydrolase [Flavisolibacter tropicus]
MKVKFLKASNGDAIWITLIDEESKPRNILIDGGIGSTYQSKDKKGKAVFGDLGHEIENLKKLNEVDCNHKIDLLILTHVDDDHIGGLLKWFEQDPSFSKLIGKIWFNSGRLISEYIHQKQQDDFDIVLNIRDNNNTSIRQGATFETYATTNQLWERRLILQEQEHTVFGLTFRILSPSKDRVQLLLNKWKSEDQSLNTSKSNDYSKSIADHIKDDQFLEDDSVHNGSSIAFILTYGTKNFLFLADAHPSVIIEGLRHFGFDSTKRLTAEFVKVSHHGSKFNTSKELLKILDSSVFIISSNGQIHNLPDKQCLARIIGCCNNPKILFNYPELTAKIFTKSDCDSNQFLVGEVSELNFNCD